MNEYFTALTAAHLLGGAGYAALGVYVLVAGGHVILRNHLLSLVVIGLLWAMYFAAVPPPAAGYAVAQSTFLIELLPILFWYNLVYRLLLGPYRQSMPEIVRRSLQLFWGFVGVTTLVIFWWSWTRNGGPWATQYFHGLLLASALTACALAAQLNRDAPVERRSALHFITAAAGLFSGAQALTFGIGLLAGQVPGTVLLLRALAAGLAGVLLLLALRKKPQWSLNIFVSPQARAYAPRLLTTVGVLAVVLAALPVMREFDLAAREPIAAVGLSALLLPVLALLFSADLSARLRVFISKHFLPFRYNYREEWLRLIDTLASPDQRLPLPERSIKAVAQIVGSPAGVLWLLDADERCFVCSARWNTRVWSDATVRRSDPVIEFMVERQWILDTAELLRDPDMYAGLERPEWLDPFPDALLVVPLISTHDLIGFIVLFQSSSAFRLTFEEIDLLRTSGRQVAAHLAQYQADQQLAEAQQFEAFNRLTAFVMHDLKNLIAQQSLMVKNAARHKQNPAFFEDAIATIENSVARMSKLLQQLQGGEPTGPRQRVRLLTALEDAVERCRSLSPAPGLECDGAGTLLARVDRERFTAVLAHLIRNAQEATRTDGKVSVRLAENGTGAEIVISDDGCGMDPEFVRTRLFRPFDSTKGSKGMGIGAYQARTFVSASGGTLSVSSEPGRGTTVVIQMPAVHEEEATLQ